MTPLEISQIEAPISKNEYNATIPAAIATNLSQKIKIKKSYSILTKRIVTLRN